MAFILLCILSYILFTPLNKKIQNKYICAATSYIIAGVLVSSVTFTGCADGWLSASIGKQGACSHHGGVVTQLNILGWIIFLVSIGFVILTKLKKIKTEKKSANLNHYPLYGFDKNSNIYFLQLASRQQEIKIRNFCKDAEINFKFKHSIDAQEIIANFTFFNRCDFEQALKSLNEEN